MEVTRGVGGGVRTEIDALFKVEISLFKSESNVAGLHVENESNVKSSLTFKQK